MELKSCVTLSVTLFQTFLPIPIHMFLPLQRQSKHSSLIKFVDELGILQIMLCEIHICVELTDVSGGGW